MLLTVSALPDKQEQSLTDRQVKIVGLRVSIVFVNKNMAKKWDRSAREARAVGCKKNYYFHIIILYEMPFFCYINDDNAPVIL